VIFGDLGVPDPRVYFLDRGRIGDDKRGPPANRQSPLFPGGSVGKDLKTQVGGEALNHREYT